MPRGKRNVGQEHDLVVERLFISLLGKLMILSANKVLLQLLKICADMLKRKKRVGSARTGRLMR